MRNLILWFIGLLFLFFINGVIPKVEKPWHYAMLGLVVWWLVWGCAMAARALFRFMVR